MRYYSRKQVIEIVETDEGFIAQLQQEEIITLDAPNDAEGEYSERMVERVRVAQNLVRDLGVNLAGAAVIVRMREDMEALQQRLREVAEEIKRTRS